MANTNSSFSVYAHYARYILGVAVITTGVIVVGLFGLEKIVDFASQLSTTDYGRQVVAATGLTEETENRITIYFTAEDRRLHPQEFRLEQNLADYGKAVLILDELTAAEPSEGFLESPLSWPDASAFADAEAAGDNAPPIASTTRCNLNAVYFQGDTIIVDFDLGFLELFQGGMGDAALGVYAVTNSLLHNLPEFRQVRFLVDGEPLNTLSGDLDLSSPLGVNLSLVENR